MASNFAFLKSYHGMHKLHHLSHMAEKAYRNGQFATEALLISEISGRLIRKLVKQELPNLNRPFNSEDGLIMLQTTQLLNDELIMLLTQLRAAGRHPKRIDAAFAYQIMVKLHYLLIWYVNHYLDGHEEPGHFKLHRL
ncbi:hypothetical protein BV56_0071 [Limosilactobacillus mucosae]|uniref:hypothetical protein n=2 Tax=Limosilactobacillus mucosae TaxID=97478 RepID=UPI00053C54E1|nr:hypothetical protein [Limosilactobacillus mucosae]PWJ46558.1 hypothetical protein BV56_0071 [Limosilactobacillus mucosae]SUQ21008.1 hypothetical protein SAMN02744693_0071 [Limosilactobacillus mucosae]